MLRVVPITIAVLGVAAAVQVAQMIPEDEPSEKVRAKQEAERYEGFGKHPRPWARDLAQPAENSGQAIADLDAIVDAEPQDSPIPPEYLAGIDAHRQATEALKMIHARRRQLDEREANLADAAAALEAAHRRILAEAERLEALRTETSTLVNQLVELEEEDLERMATLYQNMKPKEAADILNDLDSKTVAAVIERLPERIGAPILARMEIEKAREVMRLFSNRRILGAADGV